jgi:hypothetical protein
MEQFPETISCIANKIVKLLRNTRFKNLRDHLTWKKSMRDAGLFLWSCNFTSQHDNCAQPSSCAALLCLVPHIKTCPSWYGRSKELQKNYGGTRPYGQFWYPSGGTSKLEWQMTDWLGAHGITMTLSSKQTHSFSRHLTDTLTHSPTNWQTNSFTNSLTHFLTY